MPSLFRAGLVGVTGYTGMELARLLASHPSLELVRATSRSEAGRRLADLFPHLEKTAPGDVVVSEPDVADLKAACDVVFLAVPHGTAMDMAGELLDAGARVVDLSADFRLHDKDVYEKWYGLAHRRTDLLGEAVFGLVELYREKVKHARLVANPGCYPTSAILGLTPALESGIAEPDGIVIDSKSGATGAGRGAKVPMLFCEVSDSFRAYGIGTHRHTPEIEQELSKAAGGELTVSFNPHLLPLNRGILSTMYLRLKKPMTTAEVREIYLSRYADERWVRVLPEGRFPETRSVRGTMFCDLGLVSDPRTGRLVVLSAIDNLCRGASGQALANANLMLGLPEDAGLTLAPLAP
ncbi:N-acetyl-gamma-glutamyl-phosphate reductase [Desulfovibrio sp. X2]|uniref:N-acetyl-gamma-glutamyl-phosphate reductase n=1 Tax=Desulfovibrio sp. X2 TaxID=941449 RepID=UPI000358B7DA|nr:N-acetyl-gamma-glutamyl-phosphate reductase [Desulfovibrio sp. X2]EPR43719.1 N-acetyl-gamma-glutamyl-phosphate reductase [Desulfovibrio sp. X2]